MGKQRTNQPRRKKKKKGDLLLTLALIAAIAVFCFAAYNLFHIYTEYKKGTDEYNHIEQMAVTDRAPKTKNWWMRFRNQNRRYRWILIR